VQQPVDGPEGLTLERALTIVRRRAPLIVLCAVVVAGAAFAYSKSQPKRYTATASLAFNNDQLSQQVAGLPATSNDVPAQQASNLELVKLGNLAATTAGIVGHGLSEDQVAGDVSVSGAGESGIVAVSATTGSPALSATIANTYSRKFVEQQKATNQQYFQAALAIVDKQLASLSPKQRLGVDGLELQNRAQSLRLLSELDYGVVKVAQEAVPPTGASSPRTSRSTALGGILGLLIGLGIAFVLERLDRRIRGPEDLESIYGLPLLGVVPDSAALSAMSIAGAGGGGELPRAETEAFGLVRAHLRFFNVDRELRTVLVASPAPGDGKTTIALHLAEAAARAGSRVLLLEVDLRAPALSRALDVGKGRGIAEVLIGVSTFHEVVDSVEIDGTFKRTVYAGSLDVLSAGAVLPPNPAELLESKAMNSLLGQVRAAYDLVVIDAPPLTAVSDAIPLLSRVDGVVVVGRIGRSRRDAAGRLRQVLESSGATLLGVIANGAKSGPAAYAPSAVEEAPPSAMPSINGSGPADRLAPTA
jgi:succinoglycan biosynthesis transport protein ExoP